MNDFHYKPHLDGLRGLSILLVAVSHAGFGHIVPGGLGVTIFFFISGYLITSLLLKEHERSHSVDLKSFYLRRFWRLTPPVLVHVALSMIIIFIFNENINWMEPASVLFYFSNYYKLLIHYTRVGDFYSPFDIYWSLAVEEHFYLIFTPFLVFIKNKRTLLAFVMLLIAAPLVIRAGVTQHFDAVFSDEYSYRATDARMDSIAYGCLLALMGQTRFNQRRSPLLFVAGGVGLLASLAIRDAYFRQVFRYSLQGMSIFLMVAPLLFSDKLDVVRKLLSNGLLVYVGKLSYSMYLYHWLALILVFLHFGTTQLTVPWQAAYWLLTVSASVLSYHGIERPAMVLRRKFGSNV